MHKKTTGK